MNKPSPQLSQGYVRASASDLKEDNPVNNTVIDVITAPEKINSTSEWRIFTTQKIAFSPSWRLNYGGVYVQQLV